jgi:peptidoglycan/xylan/chitin deacetylase (PgdA/CDA1 family)
MFKKEDYYFLKSYIPRRLQISIRRKLVSRNISRVKEVWPIDQESAKAPEGWNGWPNGKRFALVLTHDVERVKGLNKCDQLAQLEERLGFRSSFNFVAGDYSVPAAFRENLTRRGFEVGIHGLHHGKNPFRSKSTFLKQAREINRYIQEWGAVGFRTPSMYHDFDLLHYLDIEYDASTFDTDPFEPQPDGAGTIFPFLVNGNPKRRGYVELPYTLAQDFLLFILMQEKTIDIWKRKLDWIVEHGGMALVNTHPDYMTFDKTSHYEEYPAQYYEEFLGYIKTRYERLYWNPLPKDVAQYYLGNNGSKSMEEESMLHQNDEKVL